MIINWGIPWYSSFSDLKSLVDRDRFFQVESIEPASCLLLLSRYFNAMSKVGKAMGPPKMGGEHPPGWGRLLNACYEWSYLYNYWSWQAAWFIGIMIDNLWWEYAPIFVRPSVPVDVFFSPEISHDPWQVIEDHGGVVLEFIGDAIQCIYGAPLRNESHPIYAVEAMQNMAPLDTKNGTDSTWDVPRIHIYIYTYIHTYIYILIGGFKLFYFSHHIGNVIISTGSELHHFSEG